MEWRRLPGTDPADPHGIADLLARACEVVSSSAVKGTRFLFTTDEMLRISREIEQSAMVDPCEPLYVGVQHGYRLDAQMDVYTILTAAGVRIHAFGVDDGTGVPDVAWTRVPEDSYALSSQWFLVRGGSAPQALVGFELTSDPDGLRRWEGFATRDRDLVEGIIEHLRSHSRHGRSAASAGARTAQGPDRA
ncbi:hypothetical protein BH23ACT9_BH23ACT9_22130 [soil metagenome]